VLVCWSSTTNRPLAPARVQYLSGVGTGTRLVADTGFHTDIVLGDYMPSSLVLRDLSEAPYGPARKYRPSLGRVRSTTTVVADVR
jgi:hypothetical protein